MKLDINKTSLQMVGVYTVYINLIELTSLNEDLLDTREGWRQ